MIVTIASKRTLTYQEVADRFKVKVQVVRDLMKNLSKKKSSGIIKKKEKEL